MDIPAMILSILVLVALVWMAEGQIANRKFKKKDQRRKLSSAKDQSRRPNREHPPSTSVVVDELIKGSSYVKSDPPNKKQPTEVKLGIYINSFYSISEQTMDYQVSMYLRQAWRDPRLQFNPDRIDGKTTEMRLGNGRWEEIWVPDVFFRNEKKAMYHTVTVENRLLKLNSSGFLWYVTKISATLSCPMKLQKYPLDTQMCPMMFESFGYTMDTMTFSWLDKPAEVDKDNQLPQFSLERIERRDCSQNYTGGAFPCLEIQFVLQRDIGFFLIQVYIPTILIVILSWVSFWINVDAIPARVSLGLLTVLTMTTQSTAANNGMPRVSYIKAIDVWMSMCLIFVFIALLEFAVVNVISRKGIQTVNPMRRPPPPVQKFDAETPIDQINILDKRSSAPKRKGPPTKSDVEGKAKARRIDKVSRKLFPSAFLLFNIVYWTVYTIPSGISGIH